MTARSHRFIAQGSGFALAVVVASSLGVPSHALVASSGRDVSTATMSKGATRTIRVGNVTTSAVVNSVDDSEVRHHYP